MLKKVSYVGLSVSLVLIIMIIGSGCNKKESIAASVKVNKNTSISEKNAVNSIDNLISVLKSKGHTAEITTEYAIQPFFIISPKLIKIDEVMIQVFEYKDKGDAESDAKTITKQGDIIKNSTITSINWIDKPNFYTKDNLIVLYVGKNETILKTLVDIFGNSITE